MNTSTRHSDEVNPEALEPTIIGANPPKRKESTKRSKVKGAATVHQEERYRNDEEKRIKRETRRREKEQQVQASSNIELLNINCNGVDGHHEENIDSSRSHSSRRHNPKHRHSHSRNNQGEDDEITSRHSSRNHRKKAKSKSSTVSNEGTAKEHHRHLVSTDPTRKEIQTIDSFV
jgi:hypothetical protein